MFWFKATAWRRGFNLSVVSHPPIVRSSPSAVLISNNISVRCVPRQCTYICPIAARIHAVWNFLTTYCGRSKYKCSYTTIWYTRLCITPPRSSLSTERQLLWYSYVIMGVFFQIFSCNRTEKTSGGQRDFWFDRFLEIEFFGLASKRCGAIRTDLITEPSPAWRRLHHDRTP